MSKEKVKSIVKPREPLIIEAEITRIRIPKYRYRWYGLIYFKGTDNKNYIARITGSIAQWFKKHEKVKLVIIRYREKSNLRLLNFNDYELYRYYENEEIKVWPPFQKEYENPRYDPLTGKEIYKYKVIAREAVTQSDFMAIAELEQYHYASKKELVAVWRCPKCGNFYESNVQVTCPKCNTKTILVQIKGSLPVSRFLILELKEREPFEPKVIGYVRVDPPIPLMSRRIVKDGKVIIERNIREKVFPEDWFHPTFWPESIVRRFLEEFKKTGKKVSKRILRYMIMESAKKVAIANCNTAATRIARVVIHPDYRGDGLGMLAVKATIDWVRERRIPEMKKKKQLIETIAQMARYHPFFERVGFKFVWETASGRPVLYFPLTDEAKKYLEKYLTEDEYAKQHKGVLYKSKFKPVEKIDGPIIFENVTKIYTSKLDLEKLKDEVKDVLKAFGVEKRIVQKYVLRDVNLKIEPGEIVAVVGISGAGKTTLLRLIIGAALNIEHEKYKPTSGKIIMPKNAKIASLLMGEIEPKFGEESILEHIYEKTKDTVLAVEILNICGLSDAVFFRARFSELSTGQKERAKLASLLAERPNIMIIDEFTAHLDLLTAQRVARKLSSIARKIGITLIVATNRLEVLKALMPDKILVVGYGSVKVLSGEDYLKGLIKT